jgi:hypothetical protein
MSSPTASRLVPAPHVVARARWTSLLAALAAAMAASALARAVLVRLSAGVDTATLARAVPGPIAGLLAQFILAPILPSLCVALVPLVVWFACGVLGSALIADERAAQRGQALAWLGSLCASLVALANGATGLKQGMAALGYALAWPALAAFAAVMFASRLARRNVVTCVTLATLAGLALRVLPVGWPGEYSVSWWPMLAQVPRASLLIALAAVAVAAGVAQWAAARGGGLPRAARLALLTLVPALLLRALPLLEHYGAEKHAAALASEINTSYFQVASGVNDRTAFLHDYAAGMGALPMHARTHSPTWPLVFRAALDAGATPAGERAARLTAHALGADWAAAETLATSVAERPLATSDMAGLWLLVAMLALCVMALPLATYFLASAFAPPEAALTAAAWAALLPAPLLYFPDVDVVHPLLYALVLGAWLRRDRHAGWALAAGVLAAKLVALSFGNLAVVLVCAVVALLARFGNAPSARRELVNAVLLVTPLALLALVAEGAGARPFALCAEAMRQHHVILAQRTRALWPWLNPLEAAIAFGVPSALWLVAHAEFQLPRRHAPLTAAQGLVAATLAVLLVLDVSGQTKGEAARLWMGCFPLLLAGSAPALAVRERDWPRLALLLAATLVVLKGCYVYVWLYTLK